MGRSRESIHSPCNHRVTSRIESKRVIGMRMPRLHPSLFSQARRINSYLPHLLRQCRDLKSAEWELMQMRETMLAKHIDPKDTGWERKYYTIWDHNDGATRELRRWVNRRSRGEPLQYILGMVDFVDLEIKCKPGIPIPSPLTEKISMALISAICNMLRDEEQGLAIADFCTGTGCIALLLHSRLKAPFVHESMPRISNLTIRGYDNSESALDLATENLRHNVRTRPLHGDANKDIRFASVNVLSLAQQPLDAIRSSLFDSDVISNYDVILSNPPHHAAGHFQLGGATTRSERRYAPKAALSTPSDTPFIECDRAEDQFYAALIRIAVATDTKVLVVQVGDTKQAMRVAELGRALLDEFKAGTERQSCLDTDDLLSMPSIDKDAFVELWRADESVLTVLDNGTIENLSEGEIRKMLLVNRKGKIEVVEDEEEDEEGQARGRNGEEEEQFVVDVEVPCTAVAIWLNRDWALKRKKDKGPDVKWIGFLPSVEE